MAYTTDGTANFNFFINRQGPRGPQGIQGPEGFSPNVEVEEDSGNTFTLRITNKDTSFVSSNLREHKEDRGGTYVRWDRSTEQMYLGDADIPIATDSTAGVIKIATDEDLNNLSETTAVTPKMLSNTIETEIQTEKDRAIAAEGVLASDIADNTTLINNYHQEFSNADNQNVKLTSAQTITGVKTFSNRLIAKQISCEKITDSSGDNNIINLGSTGRINIGGSNTKGLTINAQSIPSINKDGVDQGHILTQNTIVAGDNIEIWDFGNGIKISSTGGESSIATTEKAGIVKPDGSTITITEDGTISSIVQGDVTAAGDNRFTGSNSFVGECKFYDNTWIDFLKVGTYLKDNNDKLFLNQSNVVPGDNITIEETTEGIKISSTASGGGAEIDDTTPATDKVYSSSKTQELINELQATITALETRVQALEDLIDGGNAGSTYPVELQKFSEKTVEGISINEKMNSFSEDIQINEE